MPDPAALVLDFAGNADRPPLPAGPPSRGGGAAPPDGDGPTPECVGDRAATAETGHRQAAKSTSDSTATCAGVARAEAHRDSWTWFPARAALLQLAAETAGTGTTFEAYALTERFGIEMDHPNRWGALFRCAATEGLIVQVGYVGSRRPSRAGGLVRTWRGTEIARQQVVA